MINFHNIRTDSGSNSALLQLAQYLSERSGASIEEVNEKIIGAMENVFNDFCIEIMSDVENEMDDLRSEHEDLNLFISPNYPSPTDFLKNALMSNL
jgi:hypothetical protein